MLIPKTEELFNLSHTLARVIFEDGKPPYSAVSRIGDFIESFKRSRPSEYEEIREGVFAAKSAKVSGDAVIMPGVIIGEECEIRPFAYIRGKVIIGNGAVIGNSTELKNTIIFDEAQLPHYNYVGDSIVGYRAHLGAGAILSNFRLDRKNVSIRDGEERLETGLRKLGGLIGDGCEIGCGAVLCPGSIVGRESVIYPLVKVVGIISAGTVVKE